METRMIITLKYLEEVKLAIQRESQLWNGLVNDFRYGTFIKR